MKKYFTIVLAAFLITAILVPAIALANPRGSQPINIRVDGNKLDWNKSPVIIDGRNLTPMEDFLKDLTSPSWTRASEAAQKPADGINIMHPGSGNWMQGELVWLEMPAIALDGSLHIPLRYMAESMGANVRWDNKNQMIIIDFPKPKPPARPPQVNPVSRLTYSIVYTDNDLFLIVNNPTDRPIDMTFPSGQTHDFVLLDSNGKEVWRDSEGKMFTQGIRKETIPAGQRRVYKSTIPDSVPAGTYLVRAFFPPTGGQQVSAARVTVVRPNQASRLTFQLGFRPAGSGFANNYHRLVFDISNRTGEALKIQYPSAVSYRVVVKDAQGNVAWERTAPKYNGLLDETVRAGSTTHHFIRVPDLPRGRYTAEAYFPPAGNHAVARVSFNIP